MKSQRGRGARRLGAEPLESRHLMAGNVLVSVQEGSLFVHGDALANAITIEAGANVGQYKIVGLPTGPTGEPTHVNGVDAVLVSGVIRNTVIGMNTGNDSVGILGLRLRGRLDVHMGDGDDRLRISESEVGRGIAVHLGGGENGLGLDKVASGADIAIFGRAGSNTVRLNEVRAADDLSLVLGNQTDRVGLEKVGVGQLAVQLGDGNDTLEISDARAADGIAIGAGAGDDSVHLADVSTRERLRIEGGTGNDQITVEGTAPLAIGGGEEPVAIASQPRLGGLEIADAGGDNTIRLSNLRIGNGGLHVRTAGGEDHVGITHVAVRGRTGLSTGAGNDRMSIVESLFAGEFSVHMGHGDDGLGIRGSIFRGPAILISGDGTDRLEQSGNQFLGGWFEDFEL